MKNVVCLVISISIILVGCGADDVYKSDIGEGGGDLPAWILNPKQFNSEKVIYGIGIVSGVMNKALAIKTAEDRAISSIARVFKAEMETIMDNYAASSLSGELNLGEDQIIANVQRTLIDQNISGVGISDIFVDDEGSVYVRAKLDYETFEKNLEALDKIDQQMKEYIKQKTENAFGRLKVQIIKDD